MLLDVRSILHQPGAVIPFSFSMDLSTLDFFGYTPVQQAVEVCGEVRNRADVLWLEGTARAELSLLCDRCSKPFEQSYETKVSYMLSEELEEEEQDNILLLDEGCIDLAALLETEFILNFPAKSLCEENCKGLCDGCGVNLNVEPCQCKREIDPRLADLAKFFDK